MNQRMGLAIALALCLGVVSMQADAAQGAEAASASGEAQPKKRRLAKAKAAKADEVKPASGKKRKIAAAETGTPAKTATDKAAKADEVKPTSGKKRKIAAAEKGTPAKTATGKAAKADEVKPASGKKRKIAATEKATPAKTATGKAAQEATVNTDGATTKVRKSGSAQAVNAKAAPGKDEGKRAHAGEQGGPERKSAVPSKPAASTTGAATTTAQAEDAPAAGTSSPETQRPWAEGVSQENQQTALRAFREGNALLKDGVFAQAAIKYSEALTSWDHPAIHYNLVLALLNLDRPTEVLVHLNKAMAYGPDPLDPEKYEQAKQYKVLTERQLARLVVRCDLEGAVVSMDGQELFVAPGQYEGFVRPGPHSIVAKKEGYMNSEVSPSLVPGVLSEFDMILLSAADAIEYRRLWPNWRPWTVFGLGVVVAGIGAGLHVKGRADISDFDKAVNDSFIIAEQDDQKDDAVELTFELENKRSNGLRNQKIAMVMYGVGGAAVITGAVLLYVNRLRPYTPETSTTVNPGISAANPKQKTEISFLPMLAPEATGMMATVRF